MKIQKMQKLQVYGQFCSSSLDLTEEKKKKKTLTYLSRRRASFVNKINYQTNQDQYPIDSKGW